jgi:hypothetical protein
MKLPKDTPSTYKSILHISIETGRTLVTSVLQFRRGRRLSPQITPGPRDPANKALTAADVSPYRKCSHCPNDVQCLPASVRAHRPTSQGLRPPIPTVQTFSELTKKFPFCRGKREFNFRGHKGRPLGLILGKEKSFYTYYPFMNIFITIFHLRLGLPNDFLFQSRLNVY